MNFRGLDLSSPVNRLKAGFAALAVNVRAYALGSFMLRNLLTNAVVTVSGAITTLARLNDSTPAGPSLRPKPPQRATRTANNMRYRRILLNGPKGFLPPRRQRSPGRAKRRRPPTGSPGMSVRTK